MMFKIARCPLCGKIPLAAEAYEVTGKIMSWPGDKDAQIWEEKFSLLHAMGFKIELVNVAPTIDNCTCESELVTRRTEARAKAKERAK